MNKKEKAANMRKSRKKWEQGNPEWVKEYRRIGQKRRLNMIRSFRDKPCMDCGKKYKHYVMEFDHIRGEKVEEITRMKIRSVGRILEEIDKCDVVCANCHKVRTWKRSHTPEEW